jgi:hypothetical protein
MGKAWPDFGDRNAGAPAELGSGRAAARLDGYTPFAAA